MICISNQTFHGDEECHIIFEIIPKDAIPGKEGTARQERSLAVNSLKGENIAL